MKLTTREMEAVLWAASVALHGGTCEWAPDVEDRPESGRLIVIPDVLADRTEASGGALMDTIRVIRSDGRSVRVYLIETVT